MRAELKPYYGHKWRTVTRPRIFARANGRCERCGRVLKQRWELAHLVVEPPDAQHDDDDNLAALCIPCHKRHDHDRWAARCFETRASRKDRERGLLAFMATGLRTQQAVDAAIAAAGRDRE